MLQFWEALESARFFGEATLAEVNFADEEKDDGEIVADVDDERIKRN